MKEFFKDYIGLCKMSIDFFKKHWIGYFILNIVKKEWLSFTFAGLAVIFRDQLLSIGRKVGKTREEES